MTKPFPSIGYINPLVADALRDPTSGINTTQLRVEPNGCVSEALVFRSDALAKLAEKDAEIARYRLALHQIVEAQDRKTEPTYDVLRDCIHFADIALKGGAA